MRTLYFVLSVFVFAGALHGQLRECSKFQLDLQVGASTTLAPDGEMGESALFRNHPYSFQYVPGAQVYVGSVINISQLLRIRAGFDYTNVRLEQLVDGIRFGTDINGTTSPLRITETAHSVGFKAGLEFCFFYDLILVTPSFSYQSVMRNQDLSSILYETAGGQIDLQQGSIVRSRLAAQNAAFSLELFGRVLERKNLMLYLGAGVDKNLYEDVFAGTLSQGRRYAYRLGVRAVVF